MDKKILEFINLGKRSVGPAAYKIKPTIGKDATDPTIEKNPAYSILGRRNHGRGAGNLGPAYDTTGFTEHGKHKTPEWSFNSRPQPKKRKFETPGPADYCVNPIRTAVGLRMKPPYPGCADNDLRKSPAPNAYTLSDTLNRQKVTMGLRWKEPGNKCVAPGYKMLPHPDLYLPGATSRGWTMGGRHKNKDKDGCAPGPNAYDGNVRVNCCARPRGVKEDCLKNPCRFTFGRRWPDSVGVFALPRDNEYGC